MPIAQVSTIAGNLTDPPSEEMAKRAAAIKAIDGCEHVYGLRNSAGGPGLGILIWRDRQAMEAAAAHMASNRAEMKDLGVTITTDAVYDTFTEL
jgi:hypothetical protein